jgi:transposase
MQAVKMVKAGHAVAEVAEFFTVSTRAVFHWVALFASDGQNGLNAKFGSGRPSKVTPEQMRWIAGAVRNNTPNQLSFGFGLWTLRLIGLLIEREFGYTLSLPTLGKVMAQLGFTAQRPLHRAYEQDATLVQRWLDSDLPALRAHAKQRGAVVMFADEASMRSDYHTGTTWAPRGKTPIVKVTGQRVTVNMISAISGTGQMQFMIVDGRVNAEVFVQFLRQLLIGAEQPIILVVDGHPVHRSKAVAEFVGSTDGKLELHFLPPYSPQLNPDEQVWKHVKGHVAKQAPADKFEMRIMVRKALERLQALPQIVAGFFRHPECGFVK